MRQKQVKRLMVRRLATRAMRRRVTIIRKKEA
jgi:hypothetical protein